MRRGLLLALVALVALAGCTSATVRNLARDCVQCPEMVVIPAGTALLGAGPEDPFRNADEWPERKFVIRQPFAVSRHEITRDQYEAFVHATKRAVAGNCLTDRRRRGDWQYDETTTFRDPGFDQQGMHPVACVDWDDAQAYVGWLNTQTNGGYRLLTEVEWEYVARGGADRNLAYPWGDDASQACSFANVFDRTMLQAYASIDTSGYKVFDPVSCSDGWLHTAPVGSLMPNAFGVHDMIGNVSEWVDDCYSPTRDQLSESGRPPPQETCARRVAKGGSWGTLAHNVRIAERLPYPPTHRDDSIGIRVARALR